MAKSSFVYPRKISVRRPNAKVGVGLLSFGGIIEREETVVLKGIPASIQQQRAQGMAAAGLPSDVERGNVAYNIFIPRKSANLGDINDRDIIVDELGSRYQVAANYWNSLGYRLFCNKLEA